MARHTGPLILGPEGVVAQPIGNGSVVTHVVQEIIVPQSNVNDDDAQTLNVVDNHTDPEVIVQESNGNDDLVRSSSVVEIHNDPTMNNTDSNDIVEQPNDRDHPSVRSDNNNFDGAQVYLEPAAVIRRTPPVASIVLSNILLIL